MRRSKPQAEVRKPGAASLRNRMAAIWERRSTGDARNVLLHRADTSGESESANHALLNHATTGSGRDMATFSAEPIRLRSARPARNSANIQHAPIAVTL
jgi:hypothetical protein